MTSAIRDYFTRPHRQIYYPFDLGPSQLVVAGRKCIREDFHILNNNGHKLSVSFYRGLQEKTENCLIYLHTHNGSKLQALPLSESILSLGVNYCIFDFAGYGNSEGQTVSLGCKEIGDIQCVMDHLQNKYNQFKFILWGRSMGAVAALLFLSNQVESRQKKMSTTSIVAGIYDSPFQSLQQLTFQIGSKVSNLPQFLLSPLVFFIKNSLKDDINFEQLELVQKMESIKIPGIFVTSHNDTFVNYSHSESLYKSYGGKKQLVYIQRDHNQVRRASDLSAVFDFISRINVENPQRWKSVLTANLAYQKRSGKSVFSLYQSSVL